MHRPKTKEFFLILGILSTVLAVSFYDIFFLGKTFKVTTANAQALHYGVYGQETNKPAFIPVNGTDSSVLEEPIYHFIKKNLQHGILPLWNPHQALGFPMIGLIQIGMFYPLNYILYLFPDSIGWDILIIVRFLLAGLFTFWCMRTFRFRIIPSLAAAITFMLSGPMVLLQYWTANVDILLPILIIAMERFLRQKNTARLSFISLAVALTFYAGHPEHIFIVNIYAFAFFLYRLWVFRKKTRFWNGIFSLTIAYLLGIALAAMVLLPFIYNFPQFWSAHPQFVGLRNEENMERFITLILPHFFQKEPLTYQFVFAGWWGGYLGIIPVALSLISLFNKQKRGLNYFFAIATFLLISKAYGMPYINWIAHLPFFKLVRYAIHTPHTVAFSIAALTGMGVRTILHPTKTFNKSLAVCGVLLLAILWNYFAFRQTYYADLACKAVIYGIGLLAILQFIIFLKDKKFLKKTTLSLLLVSLLTAELFSYIHRERPKRFESFADVPYIEFLKSQPDRARAYGIFWTFYPNTASAFEVDDFGVFFGLISDKFVGLISNCVNRRLFKHDLRPPALRSIPLPYGAPFLDMLNVKYMITPSPGMMEKILINFESSESNAEKILYSDEVIIHERSKAFPRAYVVHKGIFSIDRDATYDFLRKKQLVLNEFVILQGKTEEAVQLKTEASPVKDNSAAEILSYSANTVLVKASMENPGFLILSDLYHPDWRVYVNGKPQKLYEANNIIRAVFLDKGTYEIKYVFRPWSFYLGAFISLIALGILLILALQKRTLSQLK